MKNKIPTAEQYLNSQGIPIEHMKNLPWFDHGNLITWLEDYSNMKAKLHVKAALEAALDSIPCLGSSTDIATYEEVEKEVLNAYPEELIK